MKTSNPNRPICPDCGKEMVFLATNTGPEQLNCYVCSCKNDHIAEEIDECREDPSPDASLCITYQTFEVMQEEEPMVQLPPGKEHLALEFYSPN